MDNHHLQNVGDSAYNANNYGNHCEQDQTQTWAIATVTYAMLVRMRDPIGPNETQGDNGTHGAQRAHEPKEPMKPT